VGGVSADPGAGLAQAGCGAQVTRGAQADRRHRDVQDAGAERAKVDLLQRNLDDLRRNMQTAQNLP